MSRKVYTKAEIIAELENEKTKGYLGYPRQEYCITLDDQEAFSDILDELEDEGIIAYYTDGVLIPPHLSTIYEVSYLV